MAKSTRFATTVTTRNLMTPQSCDGFFLDGRISGARDNRGGDITLDRDDRGFFYALYNNVGVDYKQTAIRNKKYLDKIFEDMKIGNRYNIDYEINELADCAVNISGRLTLSDSQQISPYFTGIIVKDGEMAAITSGRGCAYLYRNDLLYPLTKDGYPLSEVDLNGNPIENLDLYCAGLAGTIRYSNIAQLQPDDCFVLCNKEVMETIGHHNMLRILDEAADQQDAACRVIDEMARQNPGATAQFMIGFVENISTLDKAGLKSLTGRMNWTNKTISNPINFEDPAPLTPISEVGAAAEPSYTQLSGETVENIDQQAQIYAQQPMNHHPETEAVAPNDNILRGFDEEPMSNAKKILIAVMLVIILALASVLGYIIWNKWKAGSSTPKVTTTPTTSQVMKITPTTDKPKEVPTFEPSKVTKSSGTVTEPTKPGETTSETNNPGATTVPTTTISTNTSTTTTAGANNSNQSVNTPATTTTAANSVSPASKKYIVKAGDTVWSIASGAVHPDLVNEYIAKIIAANPEHATADGENLILYPDMEIVLPNP